MKREPDIDLGFPLEPHFRARPFTLAGCCMAAFVVACYVVGALLDNGVI